MGISRFVPVVTARTVVRRKEKRARWARILIEAAEQCGRPRVPALDEIREFTAALDEVNSHDVALLAHTGEGVLLLRKVLTSHAAPPHRVALLVGPEGGFTEEEVQAARARGVVVVHLGPRVLRAETAGVGTAALVLHHWGDLG